VKRGGKSEGGVKGEGEDWADNYRSTLFSTRCS
jgi:hypothetical protein